MFIISALNCIYEKDMRIVKKWEEAIFENT